MSDERLLSEALRAHAAGGVSTPRAESPSPSSGSSGSPGPGSDGQDDQAAGRRRRFRPLGRVKRSETGDAAAAPATDAQRSGPLRTDQARTDQARTDHVRPDQARPDVPAPRSGGPGLPPPGYLRGPMPPAPPTAPVRSGPQSGQFGPARPYGQAPRPTGPPRPAPAGVAAPAGYVPWSGATVAWWSGVALLAGGVVGSAIGVLSLLLPA
jgi:hypothetical protein